MTPFTQCACIHNVRGAGVTEDVIPLAIYPVM